MEDPAHPVYPSAAADDDRLPDPSPAVPHAGRPADIAASADETDDVDFPPATPDEALGQVVDDQTDAYAAALWAGERLIAGETVESVADELVRSGWSIERAEDLAESARRATRSERGVRSREEVAALQARKYAGAGGFTFFTIFNPMRTLSATYQLLLRFLRWRYGTRKRSDAD